MSTTFAELGVSEAVAGALAKRGIETPFAVQSMVIPDVLDGHDVLVKSPDRIGQDVRLRRADGRPARLQRRLAAGADPRPDARAGRADRRRARRRDARPRAQDHRRLRRRRDPQPGQAGRPLARARRHARPPDRPDRAPRRPARRDRRAGPRRGRPHARHGLQARRRPDRQDDADRPPDAALLGHARGRGRAHRAAYTDRTPAGTSTCRPRRRSATWTTASTASRTRPRSPRSSTSWATPSAASRSCSCAPSAAPTGSSRSSARRTSRPWPCTATSRSPSARRRSPASRRARSRRSWRPTSPRAASTSPASRTSSTTTRPARARTTCTASAARPAPARAASGITFVLDDQARDVAKFAAELGLEHGLGVSRAARRGKRERRTAVERQRPRRGPAATAPRRPTPPARAGARAARPRVGARQRRATSRAASPWPPANSASVKRARLLAAPRRRSSCAIGSGAALAARRGTARACVVVSDMSIWRYPREERLQPGDELVRVAVGGLQLAHQVEGAGRCRPRGAAAGRLHRASPPGRSAAAPR